MPANHANVDLLSSAQGHANTGKSTKSASYNRGKQQGDSFKSVIDRNDNNHQKSADIKLDKSSKPPVAETSRRAAKEKSSKETADIKQQSNVKPTQSEGEPKEEVTARDDSAGLTNEASDQQEALDGGVMPVTSAADLVEISGENLPLFSAVDGNEFLNNASSVLSTETPDELVNSLTSTSGGLSNEELPADLTKNQSTTQLEQNGLALATSAIDAKGVTSTNTANDADSTDITQTNPDKLIDTGTAKPSEPIVAPAGLKPAQQIDANNNATVKLTNNVSDELEGVPEISLKSIHGNNQSSHQTNIQLTNTADQIAKAEGSRLSLDLSQAEGKLLGTSNTDLANASADKSHSAFVNTDTSALAKTAGSAVDQHWAQQFQTVAAQTKTSGVQLQLPLNIHNPQWFSAMADRVTWLASQAIQAAEIHLDPPELGPLQVRIAVNNDQASVNFISHQPGVRDMLDSQLLRLRELFSEEGLSLIDVNVSDRQQQEQQSQPQSGSGKGGHEVDVNIDATSMVPINTIQHWVDYYV